MTHSEMQPNESLLDTGLEHWGEGTGCENCEWVLVDNAHDLDSPLGQSNDFGLSLHLLFFRPLSGSPLILNQRKKKEKKKKKERACIRKIATNKPNLDCCIEGTSPVHSLIL